MITGTLIHQKIQIHPGHLHFPLLPQHRCMIFMRLSNVSLADYCFFIYFVLLIKKNVEMKKIFKLVLFFGVMAFGLSACSDDDDDKLSGVIDSLDMQVEGTTVATQKFTYDQEGRLIKVTEPVIGEGDDV